MTRPLSRRLLTLALASALSVPAWAQAGFSPFKVSDIRIDGLQRIGAGTVFLVFTIAMVFQLLFVIFMMPETKGVSLEKLSKILTKE